MRSGDDDIGDPIGDPRRLPPDLPRFSELSRTRCESDRAWWTEMVAWSSKSIPVASVTGEVDWPCGMRMSLSERYLRMGLAWNWGFFRRGVEAEDVVVLLLLELVDVGPINVGDPRPPPPEP